MYELNNSFLLIVENTAIEIDEKLFIEGGELEVDESLFDVDELDDNLMEENIGENDDDGGGDD